MKKYIDRPAYIEKVRPFIGTVDARLIALDAKSGAKLWDIDVADDTALTEKTDSLSKSDAKSQKVVYGGTGVGIAMAPVVYRGKVIVGVTGVGYGLHLDTPTKDAPLGAVVGVDGRYGRPGFLAAYDANNGKRIWQFDTIPAQGWEGVFAETTSDGISLNRDVEMCIRDRSVRVHPRQPNDKAHQLQHFAKRLLAIHAHIYCLFAWRAPGGYF